MKNFLRQWGEAFPEALMQKLGVEVVWEPAEQLPESGEILALEMRWEGEWRGRCLLLGSLPEIAALMGDGSGEGGEAPGTPEEADAGRWRKWLQEVVEGMQIPFQPEAIKLVERPRGLPLVPYRLRAGELDLRLALACEIETKASPAEVAGASRESASPAMQGQLERLLDIEVDVSLRFGSRELVIRELLATGPGDVLELDRTISDPVDLVVGDKIVARGEVVLVNGNFGLRVTEVAEPRKCLESVRCLF